MDLFLIISEAGGLKGELFYIEKSISDQENTTPVFQVKVDIPLPSGKWG